MEALRETLYTTVRSSNLGVILLLRKEIFLREVRARSRKIKEVLRSGRSKAESLGLEINPSQKVFYYLEKKRSCSKSDSSEADREIGKKATRQINLFGQIFQGAVRFHTV